MIDPIEMIAFVPFTFYEAPRPKQIRKDDQIAIGRNVG